MASGRATAALPLARRYLEQRRTLKARGFEAVGPPAPGRGPRQQDPPEHAEAESCYAQALAIARPLRMLPLEALCHLGLGRVYYKSTAAPTPSANSREPAPCSRSSA